MPRFFFHLHNSMGVACDDEGREAASPEAARLLAMEDARSLIGEEAKEGCVDLRGRIEVHDAQGRHLLTVNFADAVELKLSRDR